MPPQGAQTVEKPLNLEKAAFLAFFGRSQRSWKMLRHKALGLCSKPRQAGREARALWALGPKAQSDPKRGSETMRDRQGVRVIEKPGSPLHPALCRQTVPPQGAFFYATSNTQFSQNRHALKRYARYHKAAANKYA